AYTLKQVFTTILEATGVSRPMPNLNGGLEATSGVSFSDRMDVGSMPGVSTLPDSGPEPAAPPAGNERAGSGDGAKRKRSCIVLVTPDGSPESSDAGDSWDTPTSRGIGMDEDGMDEKQMAVQDHRDDAMNAVVDLGEKLGSPPTNEEKNAVVEKIKEWLDILRKYIGLSDDTMSLTHTHLDKFLSVRRTTDPKEYALFALGAMYKASREVGHPDHLGEFGDTVAYEFEMYAGGDWPAADIEAAALEIDRNLTAAGNLSADERQDADAADKIAALRATVSGLWAEVSAQTVANMGRITKALGWGDGVLAEACAMLGRMEQHLDGNGHAWKWTRYGHAAVVIAAEDFDRTTDVDAKLAKRVKVAKRVAELVDCSVRTLRDDAGDMRRELGIEGDGENE
ncbi:hypothetical protein CF319_g8874, partial [Tilletia indica]